jgi:fimbrial isopeptide formation D2 family protein
MKTFKRLMSFALALLMLASVIPTSVISARAAPSNAEMMDNFVLDSMAYLGFNMDGFKKSGLMYHNYGNEIGEEGVNYAPAKIKYVADGTAANGTETTKDTTTVTGKAPYKTSFEYSGMCCGSFVAYYTMNYLYNIKGEDVKDYIDAMNTYKDGSYKAAQCWRVTLERVFANRKDVLDRIYYAEYDAKENEKPKRPSDDDYNKWAVGDIITFGYGDEKGKEHYSHVAIYLGAKNGLHWVAHSVPNRTNADGKNVSIVFGTVEMMYNASNGKTASIVTGVYRILKADHYEKTGKIEVYKKDPNDKPLAGAKFSATNTTTGEIFFIGPTDSDGYAMRKDLPFGTYKIVETTFPAGYTTSGTKEWTKTIDSSTPNATITINAVNKLITGKGKIQKVSTNGGTVEGWWFYIWNEKWEWVGRFKTGADGTFTHDFVPGNYIVREVPLSAYEKEGLTLPKGVDPQYWERDPEDKTLTITANETSSLTFNNKYYGKIQIKKSTNTGGNLEGWKFNIFNSSGSVVATLTTDSKGIATSGNLNPGTYYVKEVAAPGASDGWFTDITTSGGVVCANNLFNNSNFANKSFWSGSNSTGVSYTTLDGKTVMKVDPSVGSQSTGYAFQTVHNTGAGKYTLSADIYAGQAQTISLTVWNNTTGGWSYVSSASVNLKSGWNHIERTFNFGTSYASIVVGIGGNKSSGAFYVYHPKFVCGDTATPWAADRTVTVSAGSTASYAVKNAKGGKIAVQKNTNTGEFLSGWQFEVKDSSGKLIATLVTDASGYAVTTMTLAPGKYTVTEIGNTSPNFDPKYWDMDNKPTRTVEISADSYVAVKTETYNNTHMGIGQIQKVSTNGGTVEGWWFYIWDAQWGWVGHFKTGADGTFAHNFVPGNYIVREVPLSAYEREGLTMPNGVDPQYWERDPEDKILTITANETSSLTFNNEYFGKLQIKKSTNTGGDLEGWVFEVKDSNGVVVATLTTDSMGYATAEKLNPGTYSVTEIGGPSGVWGNEAWFFDVTTSGGVLTNNTNRTEIVTAGSTAIHDVLNVKGGKIAVQKNTNTGEFLSGWVFEVRDSNGNLIDTLVTDANGYAVTTKFLIPGKYTVTEIGNTSPDFDPQYWDMDKNATRTVDISADTYKEIYTEYYDNTNLGIGQIQKVTVNGGTVEGWMFRIFYFNTESTASNKWEKVGDYATDADGMISLPLRPGTYRIEEFKFEEYGSYPLPEGVNPEYWQMDIYTTIANVKANKTTLLRTYTNKLLGKIAVQKSTNTGGDLAGWIFEVKDSTGAVVATITTGEDGKAVTGLLNPGIYTVTEVGGPEGLFGSADWFCDISETNGIVEVEVNETTTHNVKNIKGGKIKVQKSTNTGKYLNGWLFEVKNAEGEVIATLETNEQGYAETVTLEPGEYTVTEVGNSQSWYDPNHWILDESVKTVEISADTYEEYKTVEFTNDEMGEGQIQKVVLNGGSVEGWEFKITDTDGNTVFEGVTDENGLLGFTLPEGTYYVYEVTVRDFYLNDPAEYKVVEIVAGEVAESVVFTNTFVTEIEITKETNTNIASDYEGWVFGVYTDAECTAENRVAELITATIVDEISGTVTGKKSLFLNPGTYYIKEEGRADGSTTDENGYQWVMDTHIETVTLIGGEKTSVTFRNEKYGVGKITKIAKNGSPANWSFDIWRVVEDGNEYIGEYVTLEDGTISVELLPGEYVVKEKIPEVPDPYWVYDAEPRTVIIEAGKTTDIGPFINTHLGRGRIIKETNTGNNLGGWIFGVYNDPTCTEEFLVTTITSADEDNAETGDVYGQTVFYLEPGTYWVKEEGFEDDRYDADAWVIDTSIKEVVIVASEEATPVKFTNTVTKGAVDIVKKSTNGGTVIGWQFSVVGVDNDFSETITITEELNGVGIISKSLTAGTYTITEIGHIDPAFDKTYWELDTTPRTVTIEVEQTVAVEYTNNYNGGLTVKKTLSDPTSGTVKDWEFKIEKVVKDENGNYAVESTFTAKTDDNGLISRIVEPGTYRITEILDDESPWTVVGENPKIVNVVAGQPNSVEFVNALGSGEVTIYKINPGKKSLAGAVFLLEWSEDGNNWKPVTKSEIVTKGGCTSVGLVDGTLTTGDDGVIVFAGLHPGVQYRCTEIKAPDGYLLLADYVFVGTLPADSLEVYRTVVNSPDMGNNPSTGVFGTTETFAGMMLAFMTMAMLAFVALFVLNGKAVQKNIYTKGSKNTMKKNRILSLLLVLCLTISMVVPAFAATAENATINPDALGSIELYKYDMTAATKGGVFQPDSFVSTGTPNEEAERTLREYAIEGVVFSYHKIADITTYSVNEIDEGMHIVKNLYAMPEGDQTNDLLDAIGLTAGDAYRVEEGEEGYIYFTSDVLSYALRESLAANSSVVKDKLMQFNTTYNSSQFAETDEEGHTKVENLDLGLYIIVETYVPEQVKITTAPFFVSVPSTTNDGTEWNYDLTFYPKNETDSPDLTKEVRESKADTGKNDGSEYGDNHGFQHTATGSAGDVMEYRITSTLPTISSDATNLTKYSFLDTLSKGIEYNRNDVVVEWFRDAECTVLITTWTETDEIEKFTVTYGTAENDATTMLIEMTEAGLAEINGSDAVYDSSSIYDGYSDCTVRITYAATVNSNADVVVGNEGNPNEVELTWSRTNTRFEDTLDDCCHVYTYGIDLTKKFDDQLGNFANVNFVVKNTTDNYWVVAELDTTAGVYYVTDHVENEEDATVFVPTEKDGSVCVIGLEDDIYTITETKTDAGYVLLRDAITVEITASDEGEFNGICSKCGAKLVVASATINGKAANIVPHGDSENAVVVLTVVNNKGYDQPQTGDQGTVMLTVCGSMIVMSGICLFLLAMFRPKKKENQ